MSNTTISIILILWFLSIGYLKSGISDQPSKVENLLRLFSAIYVIVAGFILLYMIFSY